MTTAFEPAWLRHARTYKDLREVPGPGNNPTIMAKAKALGARILGAAYNSDATPWCGVFIAWIMQESGIAPPPIAMRASSWDKWGVATSPRPGAVLRFQREGGGHVGLYVAESPTAFLVFGGNQGDRVCSAWIAKDRLVACRWPTGEPITGEPIRFVAGGPVSRNEA